MIFLVLRLQFLAFALGAMIPIEIVLIGMVIFQLSWLLAVTPGGIGIAEWGWVGILVRYGFGTSDAVLLSIAFRIYLVIFSLFVLSFVSFFCFYQKQRMDTRTVKSYENLE
jgi:uncharacterized membrane protein YbhN (UPF0104 family)